MASATAERQAAYRARDDSGGVDGNGKRCVSMWQSTGAALATAWLARSYGVTQRCLVETVLLAHDARILATIVPETDEWDQYFTRKRVTVSA